MRITNNYINDFKLTATSNFVNFELKLILVMLPVLFASLALSINSLAYAQQQDDESRVSNSSTFATKSETFQRLQFKLYPNPLVGDYLNIISPRSEIKEIAVLNILGEVVFKITTPDNQIQLPNLIRGIFIVKLKQGNYMGLSRLVVP